MIRQGRGEVEFPLRAVLDLLLSQVLTALGDGSRPCCSDFSASPLPVLDAFLQRRETRRKMDEMFDRSQTLEVINDKVIFSLSLTNAVYVPTSFLFPGLA